MDFAPDVPDDVLAVAVAAMDLAVRKSMPGLEAIPVPIYVTDNQGMVTYFNSACIAFTGRTPVVGQDRWCVTWRLYTEDGAYLPHDQCPMAVAIKENRAIRGTVAMAERPDGTRLWFTPYPTPITDERGRLVGAFNVLIERSEPDRG